MTNDEMQDLQEKAIERSGLPREEVLALLRARLLQEGQRKIKDEYGTPKQGVVTGLDEAFIIDKATRDALIAADAKSAELLKPYARAEGIERWRAGAPSEWVIHTVPGTVNIDDYAAIGQHLASHREKLEQRQGDRRWFELSHAEQHDNDDHVVDMKVVFRKQSDWPNFTLDKHGTYYCDAGLHIPNGDYYLAGMLNSRLYWYLLGSMATVGRDGVFAIRPEHIEQLPWPMPDIDDLAMIGSFSDFIHRTVEERNEFHVYMCEEIVRHLAPGKAVSELSEEMTRWHILSAASLGEALNRNFGKVISQDQMEMWDEFLQSAKYELNRLNSDIANAERKLDLVVYRMFGLTEEEIEHVDKI